MNKSEIRAEQYRERAREAEAAADAAVLGQVREQGRRAAAAWLEMAEAEDARARQLARIQAEA